MILRAEALSPAQKSVIEQILGRQILEAEAISLRAFEPKDPRRQSGRQRQRSLRRFLDETDRPCSGVSDVELEAALLEAIRSERPNFTPAP